VTSRRSTKSDATASITTHLEEHAMTLHVQTTSEGPRHRRHALATGVAAGACVAAILSFAGPASAA
jgi:hypothetical protein